MDKSKPETDQKTMARLRKPIDDLINRHSGGKTKYQRFRLRQLSWQAVDVLARRGNIGSLREDKTIKRLIRDVQQVGASGDFIDESLSLAVSIYQEMQSSYPDLLARYRSGK